MKTKIVYLFIGFFQIFPLFSQDIEQYKVYVDSAQNAFSIGEFELASSYFEKGFIALEGKGYFDDRYMAARAHAKAGNSEKALYHLDRIIDGYNFTDFNLLNDEKDFLSLYSESKWVSLLATVQENKKVIEKDYNWELVNQLKIVLKTDQKFRKMTDEVEAEFGPDSPELEQIYDTMAYLDSVNGVIVLEILDQYGWLGPEVISQEGSSALFLVIQHADIDTQQKYVPMMRDAVIKKKANPESLALLEDRIALRTGNKQIYGSQVARNPKTQEYYILPMIDPDQVDFRRAEVNLGLMKEYAGYFGIEWNLEEYKRNLPEYEKLQDEK